MQQNAQRISKLVQDTKALRPSDDYRRSYAAFLAAMNTREQLVQRIALFQIGGIESDSLVTTIAHQLSQAHEAAPSRGQAFYGQYAQPDSDT